MAEYFREDDHTLIVVTVLPGTKGTLSRQFNFLAKQVTTVFRERECFKEYGYGPTIALTSSIQIQRFSELDSMDEVEAMHAKLKSCGGKPPDLGTKKRLP